MKIKNLLQDKTYIALGAIFILFVVLRLPGLSLPYHQDEFKNVIAAESLKTAGEFFAHPPIMQIWFTVGHNIFGGDFFRFWPLFFGTASFFLLFYIIRKRAGDMAALATVSLFTLSFYSVWGSLMADVDGSILVFVFLLAVYFYDKYLTSLEYKWLGLMVFVMALGVLIKLSFVIAIGAILIDMLFVRRIKDAFISGITSVGLVVVALWLFSELYPYFDINFMFSHAVSASGTANFSRNWGQIAFQGIKAIFYLSPMILVPVFFLKKQDFSKIRVFLIYLILGAFFYFILFDFSQAVLDKYLMFSIVPLAVIAGVALSSSFGGENKVELKKIFWVVSASIILAIVIICLAYIPQVVVPLYPKAEWFGRVLHFKWNVLTPFNGGSGPLGFYMSFLFIALSFIFSIVALIFGLIKTSLRRMAIASILILGLSYNLVFAEELFYGFINGSPVVVLNEALAFIKNNPQINSVITFNDIGAYELSNMNKYNGRFYAAPQFEEGHKKKFAEIVASGGNFLVVEIPIIYSGFYTEFFSKCNVLWKGQSGNIPARVYKCSIF